MRTSPLVRSQRSHALTSPMTGLMRTSPLVRPQRSHALTSFMSTSPSGTITKKPSLGSLGCLLPTFLRRCRCYDFGVPSLALVTCLHFRNLIAAHFQNLTLLPWARGCAHFHNIIATTFRCHGRGSVGAPILGILLQQPFAAVGVGAPIFRIVDSMHRSWKRTCGKTPMMQRGTKSYDLLVFLPGTLQACQLVHNVFT